MKTSSVLKWALVVGIVIILNLFFNYAIALVYKQPKYEDFCKQEQVNINPKTREECVAGGGQWNENSNPKVIESTDGTTPARPVIETNSYCDVNFTCSKDFDLANRDYTRNVFMLLVALGVIAIGASFVVAISPAVSLGLSLGGVLSLIIASMRYWSYMENYLQVVVLGIALAALIWLGIKKIKE